MPFTWLSIPCFWVSLFLPFAELCDALAATTKKLEKRAFIAAYLQSIPVVDAGRAALWLSGTPFPGTDPRVLNIGGALLQKAIAQLTSADSHSLGAAYRRYGDIGAAAADLLYGHAPAAATLTLADVEFAFAALAEARGPIPKIRLLLDLLSRTTPAEAKYLIKLATGDMRTGVKQSLVEEAIAEAWPQEGGPGVDVVRVETPNATTAAAQAVRRASMLLGSLPEVVALAAAGQLTDARMKLFHPVGFMLASPVQSVEEAIFRFTEEVAEEDRPFSSRSEPEQSVHGLMPSSENAPLRAAQLEDKFDGIRAQLHIESSQGGKSRVALYSRNRDDLSEAFPELVESFSSIRESAILDGEILAWNPATERALSFSALQQRLGRKRVTAEMRRNIPVLFVVFDLLYGNGELLLEQPLYERRRHLEDFGRRWSAATAILKSAGQSTLFEEPKAAFPRLILATATRLQTAEQLDRSYVAARDRGNEGVMIKSLASTYQPGRRGLTWLKLKRELATLDVVITGVEYGNGRRAHVLSDYTFAIRDPDDSDAPLKNVGKAYSGLTDPEIAENTAYFKAHTIEDYGHFRTVEPTIVLEVAFNNVMRSSRHASGFALRFPRIIRIRTDKPVSEIDTLKRVEEIYNSQPDKPVDDDMNPRERPLIATPAKEPLP